MYTQCIAVFNPILIELYPMNTKYNDDGLPVVPPFLRRCALVLGQSPLAIIPFVCLFSVAFGQRENDRFQQVTLEHGKIRESSGVAMSFRHEDSLRIRSGRWRRTVGEVPQGDGRPVSPLGRFPGSGPAGRGGTVCRKESHGSTPAGTKVY